MDLIFPKISDFLEEIVGYPRVPHLYCSLGHWAALPLSDGASTSVAQVLLEFLSFLLGGLMMKVGKTIWKLGVCSLAVAAVATILPTVALAQSETFDSEAAATAAGWVGSLNGAGDFGPYGWSDTNFTMGNPAGEAGGIFQRTPTRNYYADTTLDGTATDDAAFSASGELFIDNETADNDVVIGHFEAKSGVIDETNHAGFIVRESTPGNFRFLARMRGDGGSQHDGPQITLADGAYEFAYSYDPGARTLTAELFPSGGGAAVATSTTTTALDGLDSFTGDAFGLTGGFNGTGLAEMTVFIDNVVYSSRPPVIPEPSTLVLLALSAAGLIGRRRRN